MRGEPIAAALDAVRRCCMEIPDVPDSEKPHGWKEYGLGALVILALTAILWYLRTQ